MRVNADYMRQAIETPDAARWRSSPSPGVERRMLDRVGDEVAVATSVVRYAPGSRFPQHEHERGEEFLVLDGVFSDISGDYGRGWYVRNPPGTAHAPWTDAGATILVKLRQFDPADLEPVTIDTTAAGWEPGEQPGTSVLRLHEFGAEQVRMYRLAAGTQLAARATPGGEEIYIVAGTLTAASAPVDASAGADAGARTASIAATHAGTVLPADTWIRNPPGSAPAYRASADTVLWVKRGHLDPQLGPDRWAVVAAARHSAPKRYE